MKRTILAAFCLVLLPVVAVAQPNILSVNLEGDDGGTGFASLTLSGTSIQYSIVLSGFEPTNAFIGSDSSDDEVDLDPSFTNGAASGVVTGVDQGIIDRILADPSAYWLEVNDGTLRAAGRLSAGGSMNTVLYIPVAATVAGQADTNFKSDARIVNRSGESVNVTLEYYPSGSAGNTGPSETESVDVASNEMKVLDDFVTELFGVTDGRGGVRLTADRTVSASVRIYNDQIDEGLGTFGQYAVGLPMSMAYGAGQIPFLSNTPSGQGTGFRSNIGWFNPNTSAVDVSFRAWDAATGALLATTERTINGLEQDQFNVSSSALFGSDFNDQDDFYVTYVVDMGYGLFVYGSVVDNVNGDAMYLAASQ
jgi:hypothetical protein